MSAFLGRFSSLPGVSCDRFDQANLDSDQFFLSHCHSDHMKGLEELVPLLRRKNSVRVNHRIYSSTISKAFLVGRHRSLDERFVKDLVKDQPVVIDVFDKLDKAMYKLRVTAVSANHCPGSVMFLFEKMQEGRIVNRILYTGDFRFDGVALTSLGSLHERGSVDPPVPLALDEMYLDTTFCSDDYPSFPPRQEAVERIWEIVQDWIKKNGLYKKHTDKGKHVVLFYLPAQYGSEGILKNIYERSGLKWKVHISKRLFDDYLCSDELGDCVSDNPEDAKWIHACSWQDVKSKKKLNHEESTASSKSIPCDPSGNFEVCCIRPSAMYFQQSRMKHLADKVVKSSGGQYFRVCYSCHSSLEELRAFVGYFRPKTLVPCVKPPNCNSLSDVLTFFKDVLPEESLSLPESLGSLGSYSLDAAGDGEVFEADAGRLKDFWSSPPKQGVGDLGRKRKNPATGEEVVSGKRALFKPAMSEFVGPSSSAAATASSSAAADKVVLSGSSDDEDCLSSLMKVARSRRKQFHRSKSSHAHASMPAQFASSLSSSHGGNPAGGGKSRRASLPYNMKIPAITITPSSPSPDPNHPDYPEFFEDKLYLESKHMSTSSTESSTKGSGSRENPSESKEGMELDQGDSFALKLSQDDCTPGSVDMVEVPKDEEKDDSIEICHESIVTKVPSSVEDDEVEVIELSSSLEPDSGGRREEEDDGMESTPPLGAIIQSAETEAERENCANFARNQKRSVFKT